MTDPARGVIGPTGKGYTGTETVGSRQIDVSTHPIDPKWASRVTSGLLTFSLDPPPEGRWCAGQRVTGQATFSNTGVEFVPAGYSPSGYLSAEIAGRAANPIFRMHSSELPGPGRVFQRAITWTVPPGAEGETMKVVAATYAGRTVSYTWAFRWVPGP